MEVKEEQPLLATYILLQVAMVEIELGQTMVQDITEMQVLLMEIWLLVVRVAVHYLDILLVETEAQAVRGVILMAHRVHLV